MKITKTIKITKEEQSILKQASSLLSEICSEFSPMPSTCDESCPLINSCPYQYRDEIPLGDFVDMAIRDLEVYDDNVEGEE